MCFSDLKIIIFYVRSDMLERNMYLTQDFPIKVNNDLFYKCFISW